jgi:protein phosphatase
LHGPVSDDEIKRILLDEPDVKKACDRLIACANEHDGPDNITVVLARFDGVGLPEPGADDAVRFATYDPGHDPEDPEPEARPLSAEPVTGETSPAKEIRPTSPELPVAEEPSTANSVLEKPQAATATSSAQSLPESRSLLAFVLVTLLAALAGALFLVSQREKIPDRSFGGTSLASHSRVTPAAAAPPPSAHSQIIVAPDPTSDAGREP